MFVCATFSSESQIYILIFFFKGKVLSVHWLNCLSTAAVEKKL